MVEGDKASWMRELFSERDERGRFGIPNDLRKRHIPTCGFKSHYLHDHLVDITKKVKIRGRKNEKNRRRNERTLQSYTNCIKGSF